MDYADSEAAFDRALAIAIETHGHAHDVTERVKLKLLNVLKAVGNIGKAREVAPGKADFTIF